LKFAITTRTDLSQAAKVLVDGFYQENSAVSKWWEKMQTQMSLESNFPHPMASSNTIASQHEMWVACRNTDGQVLAFCEVDNRPPRRIIKPDDKIIVRPYMCNLAVHSEWRKLGLAQELIKQCESSVELWKQSSSSLSPRSESCVLHLKVKEHNFPAVQLYQKMGYEVMATEFDEKTEDVLLVMKREWKLAFTSANELDFVADRKEDVSSSHYSSNSFDI
jgi:ribosomal protein S18 acetylase RimI-like enzyme